MLIVSSKHFELHSHESPEVGRLEGGHLVINPIHPVVDRSELSVELVIELALLTNVAGEAMKEGLAEQGIKLGRINYQDNGNWRPELHVHLYGRALDAKYHVFGEPIKAARKLSDKIAQEALTAEDVAAIRKYCLIFAARPGYQELALS